MKDSFGEIYGTHFSSCMEFGEKWLVPTAVILFWGCTLFAVIYLGISTWNNLDWWGFFRAIAAILMGILGGIYFGVLTGLLLIAIALSGFILTLIGCLISSLIVYLNQPDPLVAAIHNQVKTTVAAHRTATAPATTAPTATPSTASAPPPGPSKADIKQVQRVVEDAKQILKGIERDIQSAAQQLHLSWPSTVDAFIASVDVNALAKKGVQDARDLKDRAVAAAQIDAHELHHAADGWTRAKVHLRSVRLELDQIGAEPVEYTQLSDHIEAFHNAVKMNLGKRDWAKNQTVMKGLFGLITEMSPYLKEARILSFKDLSEVNRQSLTVNYRRLAMMTHPDRNPSPGAHEMFARIERAHQRLKIYLNEKGNAA